MREVPSLPQMIQPHARQLLLNRVLAQPGRQVREVDAIQLLILVEAGEATVAGHRVVRTLGIVHGNTIRARHIGRDIIAGLRNIVGGEIHEYTKLLAESREQAIDRMVAIATQRGANAIVNVRFSTAYIMSNAAEILAFGDAVVLEASRD